MNPIFHIIFSLFFTIIIYFLNTNFSLLIGFFGGAAFLDIDHYFYYLVKFKNLSLQKALQFFDSVKHKPKPAFCLFHTIEFVSCLVILSFICPHDFLTGLVFGIVAHLLLDLGQGIYYKEVHYRWWSLFQYLSSH